MRRLALTLALALALPAAPAPAQGDDRGILTRFIEDNLSGAGRTVRIEGFEGALSSVARIRELSIADDDGVWIALRGVELDWSRAALFRGRLEVNRLSAAEIALTRVPGGSGGRSLPSPEATPFALPDLPVSVSIGTISAARVSLGPAVLGEPVALALDGSAQLAGGEGQARIEAVRIDGRLGRVTFAGGFSNATRGLALDLAAVEEAGGIAARLIGIPGAPALELTVAGTAPLDDFAARIRLASDGQERLAGTVALTADGETSGFAVDVAGDIAPLFLPDYRAFFGDRIALTAAGRRTATGALVLDDLTLAAAQVTLAGAGRIAPDGVPEALALDLAIAAGGAAPVLLPIPGDPVRVGGARLTLAFDPAAGDEGWRIAGTLDALDAPAVAIDRLSLDGSGRIARQRGGAQAVGGTLRYGATGLAPRDAALAQAFGPALDGVVRFNWLKGGALRITDLTLNGEGLSAAAALALSAAGRPAVEGRLVAEVADFARASGLAGRPLGGAGRLSVEGRTVPLDGAFDARLTVEGQDLRAGIAELDNLLRGQSSIALDAARDETGTTIRALTVRAGTLAVDAAGAIRTRGTTLDARLRFEDLRVLGPAYGGALTADARIVQDGGSDRLAFTALARDLSVGIAEADGFLRGETRLAADLAHRDGTVTVDRLTVDGPSVALAAAGRATPGDPLAADLTADLTLPDLARLGPPWGGRVALRAALTAAGGREALALTGTADGLRTGLAEADGLMAGPLRFDAALARTGGTIAVDRLRLEGPALSAAVAGTVAPGEALAAALTADLLLPDLRALGPRYGGRLEGRATLNAEGGTEALTLDARASDLRIGQAEADRLLAGPATLGLAARREGGVIRLDRLRLDGAQVTATATGRNAGDRTEATVEARLRDLALLVPDVPGPVTLAGSVTADPAGYGLDLALRGPGGVNATAAGRIAPDGATASLRAQGRAESALANAFIAPAAVSGPVTFDLALNGRPAVASLSGRAALAGGRITVADPPLAFADADATATFAGGRVTLDARARAQPGGTLAIAGAVGLTAPYTGDLTIRLDQLVQRDPNLYATTLTGSVRMDGPLTGGARIAGGITLGATELRIPTSGLGAAGAIPDLRHLREPPAVRLTRARAGLLAAGDATAGRGAATARPYPLDLTFDAPNRVFIRGRGLDAELGGTLRVAGTTAAPVPIGGFELIRGRLDLLGKRFTLDRGKVFLEGDFVPRLELSATSQSDEITATISIEGRADDPEIRFRSQPELPEEEVVARLLFGRGLQTLSAFQAAQLAAAVATLTGRGGAGIVDRLRSAFGLDDLDVQTGADGATAFRAGKYLAENVYADVIFGSSGRTEVTLNYDVSRSVTIRGRARTDGTTGFGVFFERDY